MIMCIHLISPHIKVGWIKGSLALATNIIGRHPYGQNLPGGLKVGVILPLLGFMNDMSSISSYCDTPRRLLVNSTYVFLDKSPLLIHRAPVNCSLGLGNIQMIRQRVVVIMRLETETSKLGKVPRND